MKKIFITQEQFKALKEAYEKTVDVTNYSPYSCALSFKGKHGNWIHALYAVPAFNEGYLKKVRGEIYIYHKDGNDRYCLSEACLELLGITPETFNPPKKEKKVKKPAPQKTLKQELRGLDPLEKRNYLKFLFNRTPWEFIFYILPCDSEYQELKKDPDFHEGDFSPLYEMGFDSWERVRELALECSKENIKNEKYDSRKIIQRVNKIMNVA